MKKDNKIKKRTFKKNLSLIMRGLKIYADFPKPGLQSSIIRKVVEAIIPFVNIYLSALILNELAGSRDPERLIFLTLLTVVLNLIVPAANMLLAHWAIYCGWEMWRVPYNALSQKLFLVDYADLENPAMQEKYSKIHNDSRAFNFGLPTLYNSFNDIIGGIIQIIVSIFFAFSIFTLKTPEGSQYAWLDSPFTVVTVFGILAVSIFLTPYLNTKGGKAWAKTAQENKKQNSVFGYYFYGLGSRIRQGMDIRIYDQKRIIDKGVSFLETNSWIKHGIKAGWLYSYGTVISHICNGFIYLFAALKAFAGAFGIGSIVQYVGAITQFSNGFSTVFGNIGKLANNNDFLEELFEFLDTPNKKYQGTLSVEKRDDNEYEIEFRNVSFKYPSAKEYALKNLNFKLHVGKRIAVVGMNGSGKSTMIKLLCRLYDPDEGIITLNGIDIKKYNYDEYMALFSMVFQDFKLLPFTLGQNVAVKVEYDRSNVTDILEKAGFKERLTTMPKELDTYLYKNFDEEGVEISGGEEQKIALARALYKNAPFVILDEPTAALDPIAEYEIYSKFNEIIDNKTAVYISHRLSSCRFCDDIAVFHEGKMVQRGSHDELVSVLDGKYFELWNAQAQYYNSSRIVSASVSGGSEA